VAITLSDMPGVRRKMIRAQDAKTVSAALRLLRKYRAVHWADDHGAYSVHRGDNGRWFCEFMRWRVSVSRLECGSKREVAAWLKVWLPKCYEAAAK
jgi:hypothetical protein